MAGTESRRGFTLVELMVVVAILGLLVALLLPAIQSTREAGRRSTCQNNMRNAALALQNFEQSNKTLPGYAVPIKKSYPAVPYRASWVVPILPYLEHQDLYARWIDPGLPLASPSGTDRAALVSPLHVLLCPSHFRPDASDNPLHFVVNTGSAISANDNNRSGANVFDPLKKFHGQNWPEDISSGVFSNQSQIDYKLPPKKVSLEYVSRGDGTSTTLMLSENLQAGNWGLTAKGGFDSEYEVRQNTGFVWYFTGNPDNARPPNASTFAGKYDFDALGVNDRAKEFLGASAGPYDPTASTPTGLAFARPSANHPGGVNAAFCDGHMQFLSSELDYQVYTQLMTSLHDGVIVDWVPHHNAPSAFAIRASKLPASTTTGITRVSYPWSYLLREGDY